MRTRRILVCSPDTGAGKTVFTALLAGYLAEAGLPVAALKPVCSGGRSDARLLRAAVGPRLSLDEINPWHFRAPVTPLLAARLTRRKLTLQTVVAHIKRVERRFQPVVIEGAGGLLSPLGENFNSRDLIKALGATPIVVCPNRLGAINQTLLVVDALPKALARSAQIALVMPPVPDRSTHSNASLLSEFLGGERIHTIPWIKTPKQPREALTNRRVRDAIARVVANF